MTNLTTLLKDRSFLWIINIYLHTANGFFASLYDVFYINKFKTKMYIVGWTPNYIDWKSRTKLRKKRQVLFPHQWSCLQTFDLCGRLSSASTLVADVSSLGCYITAMLGKTWGYTTGTLEMLKAIKPLTSSKLFTGNHRFLNMI